MKTLTPPRVGHLDGSTNKLQIESVYLLPDQIIGNSRAIASPKSYPRHMSTRANQSDTSESDFNDTAFDKFEEDVRSSKFDELAPPAGESDACRGTVVFHVTDAVNFIFPLEYHTYLSETGKRAKATHERDDDSEQEDPDEVMSILATIMRTSVEDSPLWGLAVQMTQSGDRLYAKRSKDATKARLAAVQFARDAQGSIITGDYYRVAVDSFKLQYKTIQDSARQDQFSHGAPLGRVVLEGKYGGGGSFRYPIRWRVQVLDKDRNLRRKDSLTSVEDKSQVQALYDFGRHLTKAIEASGEWKRCARKLCDGPEEFRDVHDDDKLRHGAKRCDIRLCGREVSPFSKGEAFAELLTIISKERSRSEDRKRFAVTIASPKRDRQEPWAEEVVDHWSP